MSTPVEQVHRRIPTIFIVSKVHCNYYEICNPKRVNKYCLCTSFGFSTTSSGTYISCRYKEGFRTLRFTMKILYVHSQLLTVVLHYLEQCIPANLELIVIHRLSGDFHDLLYLIMMYSL